MADIQDQIKAGVDDLLAKFKALSSRQKINLGVIVFVAIMVIVAFFFIKSSIGKVSIDRSIIDSLQKERIELAKEREAFAAERENLHVLIEQQQSQDNTLLQSIQRQNAYLNSINLKLQSLDNEYKNLSRYNSLTSEELRKFFAELK